MIKLKTTITALILFLTTALLSFSSLLPLAQAAASIEGGNFLTGFNNTIQEGTWRDPVNAEPGQIIEFRVVVHNQGDEPANNIQVLADIPQDPATQLTARTIIRPSYFGASDVTETLTINVLGGTAQGMRFAPGHTRFFGVTSLFNCPQGCDIGDNVVNGGMEVGNIAPGETIQIGYKAGLTNVVAPSPSPSPSISPSPSPSVSPSPSPSVSPSPTPSVSPTPSPSPVGTVTCPSGFNQQINGTQIVCVQQSQTQTQNNNQSVNVTANGGSSSACTGDHSCGSTSTATTTSTGQVAGLTVIKELPATGLPELIWAMAAFIPAGLGLKSFKKGREGEHDSPKYIWEKKQFHQN